MIKIYVLNQNDWDISLIGQPYSKKGKVGYYLNQYEDKSDINFNLAFFNTPSILAKKYGTEYETLSEVIGKYGRVSYNGSIHSMQHLVFKNNHSCYGWKDGIINGKIVVVNDGTKTTRNMHGFTADDKYIHVQTSKNYTERYVLEYAQEFVHKKFNTTIKTMIIQDGGGSVQSYTPNSDIYFAPKGKRKVPTIIACRYTGKGITRKLQKGCVGYDVMLLQMFLNNVEIDGIYGTKTKSSVKQYQKKKKLQVDGIAGIQTLTALGLLGY